MIQLSIFDRSASDKEIHDLYEARLPHGPVNIHGSFVASARSVKRNSVEQHPHVSGKYDILTTSKPVRDTGNHVSKTYKPCFKTADSDGFSIEDTVHRHYKTNQGSLRSADPESHLRPYQADVLQADSRKVGGDLALNQEPRPFTDYQKTGEEVLNQCYDRLESRVETRLDQYDCQPKTARTREITAATIGEPYLSRSEGDRTDVTRIMAPVLFSYGQTA